MVMAPLLAGGLQILCAVKRLVTNQSGKQGKDKVQ